MQSWFEIQYSQVYVLEYQNLNIAKVWIHQNILKTSIGTSSPRQISDENQQTSRYHREHALIMSIINNKLSIVTSIRQQSAVCTVILIG